MDIHVLLSCFWIVVHLCMENKVEIKGRCITNYFEKRQNADNLKYDYCKIIFLRKKDCDFCLCFCLPTKIYQNNSKVLDKE